ncbi:MAG: stimulus-sensing domain-containing protein [Alphaproteobacteria bacterium]|nr:stimulus-sensing domain-containing protein [Alphaproteobacteria bacterium]
MMFERLRNILSGKVLQKAARESLKQLTPPDDAVSPLLLRILAVNIMALAILVGGILYLGSYQDRILATELKEMSAQARIVASAVAENAIVVDKNDKRILSPLLGRMMIRRLAETTENRTRLFSAQETLIADSRTLIDKSGKAQTDEMVEERVPASWGARAIATVFDAIDLMHERRAYPTYNDSIFQKGSPYNVTSRALKGEQPATQVWAASKGGLILAVAVPVEYSHKTLGAVMMSRSDVSIDRAIYAVRINILQIFFGTLFITILLSFYLARAIAHPIRQLAQAAEVLTRGQIGQTGISGFSSHLRKNAIPDMTSRRDEIGELSGALRALTGALAQRVGDIENFAADVAHELKNPLTSLRSAVETIERVQEPAARQKLMLIIRDDVDRMARLITDISSASRLDAELGRAEFEPLDIGANLAQIESYYRLSNAKEGASPRIVIGKVEDNLKVLGVRGRLSQVFQNLIDNALSFSPPGKSVVVSASREGPFVRIEVEDCGPGIPENKLEAVFDRFYTERPKNEKFGTHSGLGLSISKQIVEAHQGRIWAENRRDEAGNTLGAKFVMQLPAMAE